MKYNPNEQKEFTCEICGGTFEDNPAIALTVSRHTCSMECEAASWELPNRNPQVQITELEADWSLS